MHLCMAIKEVMVNGNFFYNINDTSLFCLIPYKKKTIILLSFLQKIFEFFFKKGSGKGWIPLTPHL